MSGEPGGLREKHRAATRRSIQGHALRLFTAHGFDAVTVADVAAAADVSSMTVFRHFPTKEDLVGTDEFAPDLAASVRARPAHHTWFRRIGASLLAHTAGLAPGERAALLARTRLALSTPALRARRADRRLRARDDLVAALGDDLDAEAEYRLWIAAGACLSAASDAVTRWAERNGRPDPVDLMARAFAVVDGRRWPTTTDRDPPAVPARRRAARPRQR